MRREQVKDKIKSLDGCEISSEGQRESAGQVLYQIGIFSDNPKETGNKLEEFVEGTDWQVIVYKNGGRPFVYNSETQEDRPSDLRVKKNLYNEHMV